MHAALFDLDGTLVDTAPGLHHAMTRLLAELGKPQIALEELTSFIGRGIPALLTDVLGSEHQRIGEPEFDAALARFNEIYLADPLAGCAIFPGVDALLNALEAAGWRMAVCTNKPLRPTRAILEALGLAPRFGAVVGGDSLAGRKPDAAPLVLAVRGLEADLRKTVFIGDSRIDAEAAANAGMPFCLFSRGYGRDTDKVACDLRFDRFDADLADRVIALLADMAGGGPRSVAQIP